VTSDEHELVAEALPAYEVGGELGRGGWGVVLEGRHRQLGRAVAIKQLPRTFAADPDVRSRFLAEARLLASLDHPHIVPVYDFVERDGLCLLVMEKLAGGTVWSRFVQRGVVAEAACGIGVVAAVALDHAHRLGILHRDVKPENLMFSAAGIMKVTDFGIAKVLTGGRTMATRAGDVLGTPAYMAPEQALGAEVGPATDIYALGVMLYELLSGRLPFQGPLDSAMALLYKHVHEEPVDLGTVTTSVPRPVVDVVMRALRKDPSDRYESAEAFGVALAEAATEGFGAGWLRRREMTLMAGGRVLAVVERGDAAVHPGAGPDQTVAPAGDPSLRGAEVADVAAVDPDELVPISDLPQAPQAAPRSLRDLRTALTQAASPEAMRVATEVERLESGAHEVRELQLLQRHRTGSSPFRQADWDEVERLLGAYGTGPTDRLGLAADTPVADVHAAAVAAHTRWQRRAESPVSSRESSDAARVLVRTCEGILHRLDETVSE
jgi:serine/threonine-protein kinase